MNNYKIGLLGNFGRLHGLLSLWSLFISCIAPQRG